MSSKMLTGQTFKMLNFWLGLRNSRSPKLFLTLIRCASVEANSKIPKKPKSFAPSLSFVKNIYLGRIESTQVFPFPQPLNSDQLELVTSLIDPFDKFFQEVNHPEINDRDEKIEETTLAGLWDIGAFGIQVPAELGGLGLNNSQYARLVEIVGRHDLAVGVSLGAHQSIGFKGILLYGTPEQKAKYLPKVSSGKEYAAFCLTEPTAGSDAASIKTRAKLSDDGSHYILNGSKIWITNGGMANIMTVFAQTAVKDEKTGGTKDAVTAFIVERNFGGITSGPPEKKMGIKASNTTEVFFDNVKIPKENVLGGVGNGFKVAMNILNNGRFGMASCLSGTMKTAISKAVEFAVQRDQFGQKISEYAGVKEKIARMSTLQYVTESLAFMISGNMDEGRKDYELEAAISKCFASEAAWAVVDEAIQIMGGMGFMRHTGLERFMRDLRIFRIFEGTNDILRLFVTLTGMKHLQGYLMDVQKQVKGGNTKVIINEVTKRVSRTAGLALGLSLSNVVHPNLKNEADVLCKCIELFGAEAEALMLKFKKDVIHEQCYLNRLSQAAIDIFSMAVVLSRCTYSYSKDLTSAPYEEKLTKLWVHEASERAFANLKAVSDPSYKTTFLRMIEVSDAVFKSGGVFPVFR